MDYFLLSQIMAATSFSIHNGEIILRKSGFAWGRTHTNVETSPSTAVSVVIDIDTLFYSFHKILAENLIDGIIFLVR